jgi:hypothetical protein
MLKTFMAAVWLASLPASDNCPAGALAFTETRLFMGQDIGGAATVSEADWHAFLKAEVIPRFPDGFTVLDGAGYWKGCKKLDTQGVCERSKLLLIQYAPSEPVNEKMLNVMDAYIAKFQQQAVMRSDRQVCTWFYGGK